MPQDLIYMWNLKNKQTLIETGEWWLPGTRLGEMGQAVNGTSFQ